MIYILKCNDTLNATSNANVKAIVNLRQVIIQTKSKVNFTVAERCHYRILRGTFKTRGGHFSLGQNVRPDISAWTKMSGGTSWSGGQKSPLHRPCGVPILRLGSHEPTSIQRNRFTWSTVFDPIKFQLIAFGVAGRSSRLVLPRRTATVQFGSIKFGAWINRRT